MEWNGQYNHRPTNDAIEQPTLIHLSLIVYFLFLRICYTCSCMFFLFHSLSLSLSLFLHWQKIFQINWRCIIQAGVAGSEMFRRWNFVEKPNTKWSQRKVTEREDSEREPFQRWNNCTQKDHNWRRIFLVPRWRPPVIKQLKRSLKKLSISSLAMRSNCGLSWQRNHLSCFLREQNLFNGMAGTRRRRRKKRNEKPRTSEEQETFPSGAIVKGENLLIHSTTKS